jgi:tRNA (mo5U34)-methyltransferase
MVPARAPGRSDPMDSYVDTEAIAERVKRFPWFHSIDLGSGIVTPGAKSPEIHAHEAAAFFDPIRMEGTSVVDIGAWNGFYSFEAKRRGAKRVLATDSYCWKHDQFHGRETFDLALSALGLDIEAMMVDVPELSPERVGTFDVVLFLGVFYHLFDPIDGLRRAAALAQEVLVVETHTDLCELDRPAMVMYPGAELAGDPTNWWGPNPACMLALLRQFGFEKVDAAWTFVGQRAVYHAWRSDALRRLVGAKERVIEPVPPAEVNSVPPAEANLKRRQKLHRGWRLIREGLGLRRVRPRTSLRH